MNPNNYASLEASNRLVKAGIVLETEALWVKWYFDTSTNMNYSPFEWRLMYRSLTQVDLEYIPAPSMAEVWRKLLDITISIRLQKDGLYFLFLADDTFESYRDNPTDALIDLLIWVRKEDGHEG